MRLGQITATAEHRYRLGLVACDLAIPNAENLMADEYRDELSQVIATQRRAYAEHDSIRDEQATV